MYFFLFHGGNKLPLGLCLLNIVCKCFFLIQTKFLQKEKKLNACNSLPSVDFGELTVAGGSELQGSGWHIAETSGKVSGIQTGDRGRGDAET